MISAELVKLLVCPEDRTPLALGDADLLARLQRAAAAGHLQNRTGQGVPAALSGVLVRADRQVGYPIVDGIPMLLVEEGILLSQVPA